MPVGQHARVVSLRCNHTDMLLVGAAYLMHHVALYFNIKLSIWHLQELAYTNNKLSATVYKSFVFIIDKRSQELSILVLVK